METWKAYLWKRRNTGNYSSYGVVIQPLQMLLFFCNLMMRSMSRNGLSFLKIFDWNQSMTIPKNIFRLASRRCANTFPSFCKPHVEVVNISDCHRACMICMLKRCIIIIHCHIISIVLRMFIV